MGRTNSTRVFAIAFASSVTVHSPYQYDWVARKGQDSIFALFCQLAPKVSDYTNEVAIRHLHPWKQAINVKGSVKSNRYERYLLSSIIVLDLSSKHKKLFQ